MQFTDFTEDIQAHDEDFAKNIKKAMIPAVKNMASIAEKATEDSVTNDFVPSAFRALAAFIGSTPESLGQAMHTVANPGKKPKGIEADAPEPDEIIDEPNNAEVTRLEEEVADYFDAFKQFAGALGERITGGRPDLTDLTSKLLGAIQKLEDERNQAKEDAKNAKEQATTDVNAAKTKYDEYVAKVAKAVNDLEAGGPGHMPVEEKDALKTSIAPS